MRTRFILLGLLLLSVIVHAQTGDYYYFGDTRIDLERVPESTFVEYDSYPSVLDSYAKQINTPTFSIVSTPTLSSMNVLKRSSQIKRIYPVYQYTDGTKQIPTGKIFIQIKNDADISSVLSGIHYTSCLEIPELPKTYHVDLDGGDCFDISNELLSSDQVIYAHPDFWRIITPDEPANNPYFKDQWGLNNTGQHKGLIGFDIDVLKAWGITNGDKTIKIAVLDEGVDLLHPDLRANLLPGYDATGQNSGGAPNTNDYHGTCCAGIIGATDNNVGVVGIAPNCKIIPIRIAYKDSYKNWVTNDSWINDAFLHARALGADICSNSWGGGSPTAIYVSTINLLANSGRVLYGSVGMPVFFASSNADGAYVAFPANLENTIAVGAASMCGTRKSRTSCDGETNWGSNYGKELHVLAPGVKIPTTDIRGSAGKNSGTGFSDYSNGDYTGIFNGTSAATPHAAAVAALMLSANPFLSRVQLTQILDSTCTKLSGYNYSTNSDHPYGTWNIETGYGMINAYRAVRTAQDILPRLQLEHQVRHPVAYSAQFYFRVTGIGVPKGCTISWEITSVSQEGVIKSYSVSPNGENQFKLEITSNYNFSPTFLFVGNIKNVGGTTVRSISAVVQSMSLGGRSLYSLNNAVVENTLTITHKMENEPEIASYSARSLKKATAIIYSSQMKVMSKDIDPSLEQVDINISHLPNGNYILNVIEDGTIVLSESFIKH